MTNIKSREYNIEVPGIPVELQSQAEKDIGWLLDGIALVADKQGMQFLLERVVSPTALRNYVNQLLNERSGFEGYVAARRNAQAIGKTLWTRSDQGEFGFAVIIDANQIGPVGTQQSTLSDYGAPRTYPRTPRSAPPWEAK